jgi:hypothetical protein
LSQCIFCLQEKEKLTEEHVFLAALGGVVGVNDSSCEGCNHGFSKFEQPVITELTPIRLLLKIPDRYGAIPQAAAILKTADKEYAGRVKGDGSVRVKPIVTEVKLEDGRREFVHQFATERQKERLRQEAQEKGREFVETGPGEPIVAEVHVGGDLRFIGAPEGLRTAAKTAYVGLAFVAGKKLAMSDAFDAVRAYIRDGSGHHVSRLFVHERFLEAVQQGPHQHSLIIAARNNKKRVDAIVRLFGGICYLVTLSDNYGGADFNQTLVYDASRGEANGILQSHVDAETLEIEDVLTSKETVWDDLVASGKRFCAFLDEAVNRKMARERAEAARKDDQK